VILAAWYSGKWPAVGLAIAIPLFRLIFMVMPLPPERLFPLAFATSFRALSSSSSRSGSRGWPNSSARSSGG
jgi:hypothetical protein